MLKTNPEIFFTTQVPGGCNIWSRGQFSGGGDFKVVHETFFFFLIWI